MSEDNAGSQTRQGSAEGERKRLFDMLDHTTFRNAQLLKQKNELSQALAASEERFGAITSELEKAQAALDARNEQADQLERLHVEARAALVARQSTLEKAKQNLAEQQQQLDGSNEALAERKEQLALSQQQVNEQVTALAAADEAIDAKQQKIFDLEQQLKSAYKESAEFRVMIGQLEQQKSGLSGQIKQLQNDYAALESRLRQREEEVEQTLAELRQRDKSLAEALAKGKSTDEQLNQLNRDLAKRTQNLEKLQARQVQLKAEKAKLTKDLAESEGWVFKLAGERGDSERKLARTEREMARQAKLHQQEILQYALLAEQLARAKDRAFKAEQALCDRPEPATATQDESTASELEDLRQRLAIARSRAEGLDQRLDDAECRAVRGAHLQAEVEQSKALLARRDVEIAQRFEELATVTRFLREAEIERSREDLGDSLTSALAQALNNTPWWWALLPGPLRQRKKYQRLRRQGLFDGERYLRIYPDVEAAKMDALDHFLKHGLAEGRTTAID